jgi:hypothetical protein
MGRILDEWLIPFFPFFISNAISCGMDDGMRNQPREFFYSPQPTIADDINV